MYTIESLAKLNPLYHSEHRIDQDDADRANKLIGLITKARTDGKMCAGDIVEITTRYGDYYRNGHIGLYDAETDKWSAYQQPHTPFVFVSDNGNLSFSAGGGGGTGVPNNLVYLGKRKKLFKVMKHCIPHAHASFMFEAEVNVWEFKEADPYHGTYTTKDWRRYYI